MATTLTYLCDCGKKYMVFVSKKILITELMGQPERTKEAERWDKEEEKAGEIEMAKEMAKMFGADEFIDTRVNEVYQCECGKVFDLLAFYRSVREEGKKEGGEKSEQK